MSFAFKEACVQNIKQEEEKTPALKRRKKNIGEYKRPTASGEDRSDT